MYPHLLCLIVAHQRVILDEGHSIRNPKTKMAKSVVALKASRRWVLTGTPIVSLLSTVVILAALIFCLDQLSSGMRLLCYNAESGSLYDRILARF